MLYSLNTNIKCFAKEGQQVKSVNEDMIQNKIRSTHVMQGLYLSKKLDMKILKFSMTCKYYDCLITKSKI